MPLDPDLIDHGFDLDLLLSSELFNITLYLLWPVITVRTTCSMYKDNIPHTVLTNRHFSVGYGC